tara:strand:+ start:11 stop:448 length:438 start_codon:yes stop_codon:yes gene_type:complete
MNSPLQPDKNNSQYSINQYGENFIEINGIRWHQSCIVSTNYEPIQWEPELITDVNKVNLAKIRSLNPEILILGTGNKHFFLPQNLLCFNLNQEDQISTFLETNDVAKSSINIECMSTPAACRTFNILAAEERKVVAAILITGEKK